MIREAEGLVVWSLFWIGRILEMVANRGSTISTSKHSNTRYRNVYFDNCSYFINRQDHDVRFEVYRCFQYLLKINSSLVTPHITTLVKELIVQSPTYSQVQTLFLNINGKATHKL